MTRAGLVTLMGLAAWYYGRNVHPLVLLPLAAAITALANPSFVWGDMGWYLSFGSFAGVLLLAPLIQRYFWGSSGEPGVIRGILVETSSAQLATMPIIFFAFGTYSAYSLLANMIILPLIPLTMLLTFIAGIAGVTAPAIAPWIGAPASLILEYMTRAVGWVANLPGSQGEVTFNIAWLVVSYLAMAVAILYMWHRTGYRFKSTQVIGERA
jgi:competence protein ComEC